MNCHTVFSLSLPVSWKIELSRLVQERNIEERRRVTMSELIREALQVHFGFEDEILSELRAHEEKRLKVSGLI